MATYKHQPQKQLTALGVFGNPLWLLFALSVSAVSAFLIWTPYYYLALVVGPGMLLALYIVYVNPAFGLYVLLFLVPFDEFREVGGEAMRFLTISKLLGVLVLAAVAWRVLIRHSDILEIRANLWIWVALFAFFVTISSLYNGDFADGAKYLRQFLTAAITMTLVYSLFNTQRDFELVPIVVSFAVTLNAILGLVGYFFEIPWLSMGSEQTNDIVRATGGERDPNVFSSKLIFILPFLAYWFTTSDKIIIRLSSAAAFLINVFAVMLTLSRSGTLAMLAILIVLASLHLPRLRPIQIGLFIVLAFGLGGVGLSIVPEAFWNRMVTLETGVEGQADRSLSRRASYVSVAWDRFVESPLIGHGPLSYPELYAKSEHAPLFGRSKTRVNKGYQRPAHNTYLETLVETGLAGLAAFVALLFVGWRNFSQSVSRFRQLGYMRLADLTRAYQVAFLSQLIYFLFLSQTFAKLAWVALGMSVIAVRLSKRHVEDENIPKNLTELTRSSG